MMYTSTLAALALVGAGANVLAQGTLASYISAPPEQTLEPTLGAIEAAAATAAVLSPVSNVKGAGFDRIIQIWLENVVSFPMCMVPALKCRRVGLLIHLISGL